MTSNLDIPGTASSPAVIGDWGTGVLSMQGDSYPENAHLLFEQVLDWLRRFLEGGSGPLKVALRLVYLNTSSIKGMMDICDLLEEAHRAGRAVRIDWYYDPRNERVADLADEFREDCSFPFDIQADA